jgi:Mrp family chromosome partitioning ATPase
VLGGAPDLTARALRQIPPDQRTPIGCLAFLPASPFATAFRDLQGSLSKHNAVAFIGGTPGEGATTAALCAAASAAQQGRTVIVVDCDLRQRALTRAIGEDPAIGLMEASQAPDEWRDFLLEEPETGVHILPAARNLNPWQPLLSQPGFRPLISELREAYDLVVLDCPPALTSAEGAVVASLADETVAVTAWDRTRVSALGDALRLLKRRECSIAGIYVNRVPPGYRFGRLRGA